MRLIHKVIHHELSYFHQLSQAGKTLIISYALSGITDPVLYAFFNTFLWRETNDMRILAWYNFAFYAGLPLGFYLNGKLLKYISSTRLYLVGCVAEAVVVSALIFLSQTNYLALLIFGITFGMSAGLFWANRNFLTLRAVKSENRIYFSSLEANASTITGIIIPVAWDGF